MSKKSSVKISDILKLSKNDLLEDIKKIRKELFINTLQFKNGSLKDSSILKKLKKKIAVYKTALSKKFNNIVVKKDK